MNINLLAVLASMGWTNTSICILSVNNFFRENSKHLQNSNITIILVLQSLKAVKKLLNGFSMLNSTKYKRSKCKTYLCQKLPLR